MPEVATLEDGLARLREDGYLIISPALSAEVTEDLRLALDHARESGLETSGTGTSLWFDRLPNEKKPLFDCLAAHPAVEPYVHEALGPGFRLLHIRGVLERAPAVHAWQADLYGRWSREEDRFVYTGTGLVAAFPLQDSAINQAGWDLVVGGHRLGAESVLTSTPGMDPHERLQSWSESHRSETVLPLAGDCLLYYSHTPHRRWVRGTGGRLGCVLVHFHSPRPPGSYGE